MRKRELRRRIEALEKELMGLRSQLWFELRGYPCSDYSPWLLQHRVAPSTDVGMPWHPAALEV